MDPELAVAAQFMNHFEAEVALTALEAAGIEASIRSDDCGGLYPQLSLGAVDVIVRSEDLARATEVLRTAPAAVAEHQQSTDA
jgi:Putative prokaryotic signal transducing protein